MVYRNLQEAGINLISGALNLTYVENRGAAFGALSDNTILLTIISAIIIAVLLAFIFTRRDDMRLSTTRHNPDLIRRNPEI